MLQKIIKNLRSKPASVKRGITLGVSLGVTGVASFFWFISFVNYSTQVLSAEPKVESPTNFLGRMSDLIGESYANVRTKIDPTKGVFAAPASTASTSAVESSSSHPTSETQLGVHDNLSGDAGGAINSGSTGHADAAIGESKSLNDILNTKKSDNQGAKATTSGEVLVQ